MHRRWTIVVQMHRRGGFRCSSAQALVKFVVRAHRRGESSLFGRTGVGKVRCSGAQAWGKFAIRARRLWTIVVEMHRRGGFRCSSAQALVKFVVRARR